MLNKRDRAAIAALANAENFVSLALRSSRREPSRGQEDATVFTLNGKFQLRIYPAIRRGKRPIHEVPITTDRDGYCDLSSFDFPDGASLTLGVFAEAFGFLYGSEILQRAIRL